jgi:RNA polymerase sigma-70 factor (ECF subfamily)
MDELVRLYQRRVYGVIHNTTGSHGDVDDLCQETFLQVFRGMSRLREIADLDAWVYRIAMNVSVDYLRRKTKDRSLTDRLRARQQRSMECAPAVSNPELAAAVQAALHRLPPEQKAVIVLRMHEGLEHDEIARVLGIPLATARWRLFAARRKLEELLASHL